MTRDESEEWRTSSRSSAQGQCVELARTGRRIAVRDSKNPGGHRLNLGRARFGRLLSEIRAGEHDL